MRTGGPLVLVMLFLTGVVVYTGLGGQFGPDRTYLALLDLAGRPFSGPGAAALSAEEQRAVEPVFVRLGILDLPEPRTLPERIGSRVGLVTLPAGRFTLQVVALVDEWPADAVVVVTTDAFHFIPGSPEIGFHLVRSDGTVTSTSPVPTGWRTTGPEIRRATAPRLGLALYEVEPASAIGGRAARQFYARSGDGFVLIRMEDPESGTIVKNEYGAPNFTVGPPAPHRGEHDWLALLDSGEPVKVLEALVWLGGVHLDPEAEEPDTWHEDVRTAGVWKELVTSGDVKGRLESLAASDVPWIAEAARSALDVTYYRP